jgi:hypothetical protein
MATGKRRTAALVCGPPCQFRPSGCWRLLSLQLPFLLSWCDSLVSGPNEKESCRTGSCVIESQETYSRWLHNSCVTWLSAFNCGPRCSGAACAGTISQHAACAFASEVLRMSSSSLLCQGIGDRRACDGTRSASLRSIRCAARLCRAIAGAGEERLAHRAHLLSPTVPLPSFFLRAQMTCKDGVSSKC